jgi:hypothetical protein
MLIAQSAFPNRGGWGYTPTRLGLHADEKLALGL